MRKSEVEKLLFKCAEISGKTDFVIIGSQAIHGTLGDPNIDAVVRSPDLDFYPKAGYDKRNIDYEAMMREVGQDSTYPGLDLPRRSGNVHRSREYDSRPLPAGVGGPHQARSHR